MRLLVGTCALLAGCFSPSVPSVACDESGLCPAGLVCGANGTCQIGLVDAAAQADAAVADAGIPGFCGGTGVTLCLEFEGNLVDGSPRANTVAADKEALFATGVSGMGIRFDGTYAVTAADFREPGSDQTVELWLTVPPNDQSQRVLRLDELDVTVESGDLTVTTENMSVSVGLDVGVFNYVALRNTRGSVDVLVAGALVEALVINSPPATELLLGGEPTRRYVGTLDQLRVWTRPLTNAEIADVYDTLRP